MKKFGILIAGLMALFMYSDVSLGKEKSSQRDKVIRGEGRTKTGSKTKIDFGATDIGGGVKSPMASMLTNTKAKKESDFVPIRTDWKPEMMQSAASLDAGRQ